MATAYSLDLRAKVIKRFASGKYSQQQIAKKLNITYKKTLPIRGKTGRFERGISKSS